MKLSSLSDCDVIIIDDYYKFMKEKCKAAAVYNILPDFYLTRKEYINDLFKLVLKKCMAYQIRIDDIGGRLGEWVIYVLENILNIKDFTNKNQIEYIFDGLSYEIPDYECLDEKGNLVFYVDYMKSKDYNFDLKKGMQEFVTKEKQSIKSKKLYDVYGINPDEFESIYYQFLIEVFKNYPKNKRQGFVVRPAKYLIFYLFLLYGTQANKLLMLKVLREMKMPIKSSTYDKYKRTYVFILRLLKAKGVVDKDFNYREGYFNYKNGRK